MVYNGYGRITRSLSVECEVPTKNMSIGTFLSGLVSRQSLRRTFCTFLHSLDTSQQRVVCKRNYYYINEIVRYSTKKVVRLFISFLVESSVRYQESSGSYVKSFDYSHSSFSTIRRFLS